jgi:hypothetical protein
MITGRTLRLVILPVFLALWPSPVQGQAGPNPSDPDRFSGIEGQLSVTPPRISDPDISVDGRLEEAVWEQAAVLDGFSQYEPTEGILGTQITEILTFYSDDAIYFGIRAFDTEPDLILARLTERDRSFSDDWVRLMLDTFDDQRQAYVFYVNPLGIQSDGLWIEGIERRGSVSIDFNPDFIWESDGQVTDWGWQVEIRIPYLSLRFRDASVQEWGFNVAREIQRDGYKESWAPLTADISNALSQSGRLVGLTDVRPKRLVEINPEAWGKLPGEAVDGEIVRDDLDPEFGLNARLGITPNLILDATYNPDFSQVEADVDRVTVNERFALFFPEKRPFFLEGTEIFNTPQRLVYTRTVADPLLGAKVTGKVAGVQLGYLGSVDEGPVSLYGGENRAVFNFLRARQDLGASSTLGILYTDRTLESGAGYNRVVGADTRLQLGSAHTLTAQAAASWTLDDPSESRYEGSLVSAQVERSGRALRWQARFLDVSSDFRARSGFIQRIGDTETAASVGYTWYRPPGSFLERYGFETRVNAFFDHEDFWDGRDPEEAELEFQPNLYFRGSRLLWTILRVGYFRFQEEDYDGYEVRLPDGSVVPYELPDPLTSMLAVGVLPRFRINNAVTLNGTLFAREVPIYAEGSAGYEFQIGPEIQLSPTAQLQLDLRHTYSRIWRSETDRTFSTANISRIKAQYQFTRSFLARVVAQYNLLEQAPLIDPTTGGSILVDGELQEEVDRGVAEAQVLASYEPSPGTIFYLGYSRAMAGTATWVMRRLDPVADSFFLKVSYLFRL